MGRSFVRNDNDVAGRGYRKKQMPVGNKPDIGVCLDPKGLFLITLRFNKL